MKIEKLDLNDVIEIVDLIWKVQLDSNQIPVQFRNQLFKDSLIDSIVRKILNDNLIFYGIKKDNELIATIGIKGNYIMYLYVIDKYQRKGIGTILIRYALEILKNYERITIDSTCSSMEFYKKIGFVVKNKNGYNVSMEYKKKPN